MDKNVLITLFICMHCTCISNCEQLDTLYQLQRLSSFQVIGLDEILLRRTEMERADKNWYGEVRISNASLVSQMFLRSTTV